MKYHIIGGGLTGLVIARELKDKGNDVVVYEMDQDIGGLCQTYQLNGIGYEYGPHILYYRNDKQKKWWAQYVDNKLHDYYVKVSPDGTLKNLLDFPPSKENNRRLGIEFTPQSPDRSSFENYMISQIGQAQYDAIIKGYNIKQWGIHPKDMGSEWCPSRPLHLHKDSPPLMFGNKEAGHPGSYRPLFDKLSQGILIQKNCRVRSFNYKGNRIVGFNYYMGQSANTKHQKLGENDIVINTSCIDKLGINKVKLGWRGVCKIFVVVKGSNKMPTYSTTFPNNYSFTRVMEYPHQTGERYRGKTLLSFAFPYTHTKEHGFLKLAKWTEEVNDFIAKVLKSQPISAKEYITKPYIYPVSTNENMKKIGQIFADTAQIESLYTCGRLGLFAYISMARAVEMALELVEKMPELGEAHKRMQFYLDQRANVW